MVSTTLRIAYNCQIESLFHDKFQKIMELDNISYDMILDSLDVVCNQQKVF